MLNITLFPNVRPLVFWPPTVFLVVCVGISLVNFDGFLAGATSANSFILKNFDWLFSSASFGALLLMAVIAFSPLGRKRIGGADAKPILSRWNWFAITLSTTIAIGILFWGTAEPLIHVTSPPDFAGVLPGSRGAQEFALSTMFLHWTFTPYAIYAVPTLAFALSFHTFRRAYSFSGPLGLLTGTERFKPVGSILDSLALFALVAGVAAALGAGVLTLTGGIEAIFKVHVGIVTKFIVTALIVAGFILSSLSGLQRGIRWLSSLNVKVFLVLALFVFIMGPTLFILKLGAEGFGEYISTFIPTSLALGERSGQSWTHDWPVFYFANWLAWAPISALFLGRIAVGYTVREFIAFNLVIPSLFSVIWMTIFGGAALGLDDTTGGAFAQALSANGPESVVYVLFSNLPLEGLVSSIFLMTVMISFITAMDSNTLSISDLCLTKGDDLQAHRKHQNRIKIFWGLLIGSVSFIMTSTNGIDGIRMLSNLGGVPGLLILILSGGLLVKLLVRFPDPKNCK